MVVDSYKVNLELKIEDVNDHGFKVTQGEAATWRLLQQPDVSTVLVLEENWTPSTRETSRRLLDGLEDTGSELYGGLRTFLERDEWSVLRLGYSPMWVESRHKGGVEVVVPGQVCPLECRCAQSEHTPLVCKVDLPVTSAQYCNVGCARGRQGGGREAMTYEN